MKLLLESQNHRNVEIPMRAEDDVLLAQENNDPLASNIYVAMIMNIPIFHWKTAMNMFQLSI